MKIVLTSCDLRYLWLYAVEEAASDTYIRDYDRLLTVPKVFPKSFPWAKTYNLCPDICYYNSSFDTRDSGTFKQQI